ncbi:transcriptional regulator [Streptomyces sp. NBC_01260]|uniref:ParB/RepB/Spo0J family partition protein n=1 Tax=unclassified Streptomyces TaxID=2593676 RepID=UPI002251B344|nr:MULTISPECIES: transcriptional regulator [unclassified Streptomyces]MCX4771957.1 transcriptional regulator [Streptomyces sp. NBC_01285]
MNRHIVADLIETTRTDRVVSLTKPTIAGRGGERVIISVPISMLLPGESPRLEGQEADHVARLAELDVPLPPILVDRRSMRVIDGMHRLMAALLKGDETIDAELFEGTTEEAFLRAVEANVTHGLPLSREDRRAAAARIIASHPEMSDRAIARAAGLGAKAVATVRRTALETAPLGARVGRDGKVRPLSSVEGRRRAAELIAENPQASLREVARHAGISPATVSDVRKRLMSGESPVPEQRAGTSHSGADQAESADRSQSGEQRTGQKMRLVQPAPASLVEKLLRDPSLRHKEEGRHLLRVLQQNALGDQGWAKLAAAVPSHYGDLVVDLARQYAETWMEFAKELDGRIQKRR